MQRIFESNLVHVSEEVINGKDQNEKQKTDKDCGIQTRGNISFRAIVFFNIIFK